MTIDWQTGEHVPDDPTCRCGSGEYPEDIYDARGIYVTRACSECVGERTKGFRPEIFTDANYHHDEPIEPEEY